MGAEERSPVLHPFKALKRLIFNDISSILGVLNRRFDRRPNESFLHQTG